MTLEHFKTLPNEEILKMMEHFASLNFEQGEESACDYEYGNHQNSTACVLSFEDFLKNYYI